MKYIYLIIILIGIKTAVEPIPKARMQLTNGEYTLTAVTTANGSSFAHLMDGEGNAYCMIAIDSPSPLDTMGDCLAKRIDTNDEIDYLVGLVRILRKDRGRE